MKKTLLAWAAGLLDGEGALMIKRVSRPVKDGKRIHYQLFVTIGMSDKPENIKALEIMNTMFGGSNRIQKQPAGSVRRDAACWMIVSRQGLSCLKKLLPYLIVKKEHAKLLIDFQTTCITRFGPNKDYKNRLIRQEQYFYKLRELNTKGVLRLKRLSEETPKGDAIV